MKKGSWQAILTMTNPEIWQVGRKKNPNETLCSKNIEWARDVAPEFYGACFTKTEATAIAKIMNVRHGE